MYHMLQGYKYILMLMQFRKRKKQYFTTGTRKILLTLQMQIKKYRYLTLTSHEYIVSSFSLFCNTADLVVLCRQDTRY